MMIMETNKHILTLIISLCFTICQAQIINTSKIKETNSNNKVDTVYDIGIEDMEMSIAIKEAQQNFGEFEKAIHSKNSKYKNFTLKKNFQSDDGDEHIWIMYVMPHPKKNVYVGFIGNVPIHTKKVKYDEIVEVSKNDISDWMYYDNGVLKGAYTTKILRSRMSDDERQVFDEQTNNNFKISN